MILFARRNAPSGEQLYLSPGARTLLFNECHVKLNGGGRRNHGVIRDEIHFGRGDCFVARSSQ
jgi:hypothetical protein